MTNAHVHEAASAAKHLNPEDPLNRSPYREPNLDELDSYAAIVAGVAERAGLDPQQVPVCLEASRYCALEETMNAVLTHALEVEALPDTQPSTLHAAFLEHEPTMRIEAARKILCAASLADGHSGMSARLAQFMGMVVDPETPIDTSSTVISRAGKAARLLDPKDLLTGEATPQEAEAYRAVISGAAKAAGLEPATLPCCQEAEMLLNKVRSQDPLTDGPIRGSMPGGHR